MHQRQQIREAIAAQLVAGLAGVLPDPVAEHVHTNRALPVGEPALPAVLVYAAKERPDGRMMSTTQKVKRVLTVVVEAAVEAEDVDGGRDDLGEAIETAILATPGLGLDFVEDTVWTETEIGIKEQAKGRREYGSMAMVFEVAYWYQAPDLEAEAAVELREISAQFDLPPDHTEPPENDHEAVAELE